MLLGRATLLDGMKAIEQRVQCRFRLHAIERRTQAVVNAHAEGDMIGEIPAKSLVEI